VERQDGYEPRNTVKDYVSRKQVATDPLIETPPAPPRPRPQPAPQAAAAAAGFDDDIPF